MNAEQYCREKAAARGSSLHYTLRFAERDRQPALYALHAFHAEVMSAGREISEPAVASVKLNWWREELERLFRGEGRHPVSQALAPALERYNLPREYFEEMIQAAQTDLDYNAYPDFKALSLYCHRAGGALQELLVEVNGYRNRETSRYAHDLGMALQLGEILRRVRQDALVGRVYLPEDEMRRVGIDRGELLRPTTSDKLREFFALQADRIDDFTTQALQRLAPEDARAQRSGLIRLILQRRLLDELRAERFPLLDRGIHLTPLRKLWLAWRTARSPVRARNKELAR
ncbi:squalene/phytoene synthase family protein [Alkalilimnicola sp. S0819]|uniref:squalene/phytoene synthase family protein n=1 Tax=Alkalilimnicola sp. S0819 TaxID=2613922 RepID=UPI001261E0D9|nr:squalene/phytoene synthase family protein [Alkalilimnicola sp. S0819]KAB7623672.1 squalene synthase HpnD [Alkalilimnicola sp. S0819]MPQ16798.1 squalene synthase HpnD [Alkalilimnicola sp. S0819]